MYSVFTKTTLFRVLSFTVLLFFVLLLSPLTVRADDFYISADALLQYNGPGGDVTVPSGILTVGSGAFSDNLDITSVTIPEGCTIIEDGAFDGCENLRTVSLPNTLTDIGTLAFARCRKLEYIILPPNVKVIGTGAFDSCNSIGSVTIPASVESLGIGCFAKCMSLLLLNVDPGNKNYVSVNNVLFSSDMKVLEQYPANRPETVYEIPEGVETISVNAFRNARNLRDIIFPKSLSTIRDRAFSGCTGLTKLDIPETLVTIHAYGFSSCTNLCRVYVHNPSINIFPRAFESDSSVILYGPEASTTQNHAVKYNIRFRSLDDDTYDYPDPEKVF